MPIRGIFSKHFVYLQIFLNKNERITFKTKKLSTCVYI